MNADEYELIIRNIQTNDDIQLTTFRTFSAVVLDRGNQYSWWVISKYNADQTFFKKLGMDFLSRRFTKSSHFPFPANLLNPKSNDQISLIDGKYIFRWETTDLDNDIIEYDMYLGTDPAELILIAEKLSFNYVELSLNSNQFYYWKSNNKRCRG